MSSIAGVAEANATNRRLSVRCREGGNIAAIIFC